jgi:membrane protein implicated in regulation of membrane protease activity
MSDLERRSGSRPSRRQREQRAYRLVLATGTFTVLFVAAVVLTLITSFSGSWAVLFAVLAVISGLLLRRTVRP